LIGPSPCIRHRLELESSHDKAESLYLPQSHIIGKTIFLLCLLSATVQDSREGVCYGKQTSGEAARRNRCGNKAREASLSALRSLGPQPGLFWLPGRKAKRWTNQTPVGGTLSPPGRIIWPRRSQLPERRPTTARSAVNRCRRWTGRTMNPLSYHRAKKPRLGVDWRHDSMRHGKG
jgi:hypothetical protein